ncbi:IS110 family transposase [Gemmatimonadota bacterium]
MSVPSRTIGLDLGDRHSHFCVLDQAGKVIERGHLVTSAKSFRAWFGKRDLCRVVIEACGISPWVDRLLIELGFEAVVANPRKMRLIYLNDTKNDQVDAEYLARLGRLDPALLSPIRHRRAETMTDRATLRSRELMVRTRTRLINHVRGIVKTAGGRVPRLWPDSFSKKAQDYIPDELRLTLEPILEEITRINVQIRDYDERIEYLAQEKYPETELLTQVPGVGTLTALAYVLTIEDPYRFTKSRQLGSYLGLRPRQDDSGDRRTQLRITKAGDSMLRKLLVQCANHILGPWGKDSELRDWGLKLCERGGKAAKKRATIAVARKLAILLHRLWITAEVYEPYYNSVEVTAKAG